MGIDDVDRLISVPLADRGPALATAPENQWFERKSAAVNDRMVAKAIIGMANAEGGMIVVGLGGGTVESMRERHTRVNRLRRVPLDAASALSEELAHSLPTEAADIVKLLRSTGPLGTGDVASAMALARPTVLRALKSLRARGLVSWTGNSPKDPRAVWSVQGAQSAAH